MPVCSLLLVSRCLNKGDVSFVATHVHVDVRRNPTPYKTAVYFLHRRYHMHDTPRHDKAVNRLRVGTNRYPLSPPGTQTALPALTAR